MTRDMWHVTNRGWWALSNSLGVMMSCDIWHMTFDIWHMTCAMWHATCETLHVTCTTQGVMSIISKFQVPSSNGLGVLMFWRFGGKAWVTELLIDKSVCRAAPDTPGLLNSNNVGLEKVNTIFAGYPAASSMAKMKACSGALVNWGCILPSNLGSWLARFNSLLDCANN